jgi:hypothetical protein
MRTTMPRHSIRGGSIACAAAMALLATGCHVNQPDPPTPSSVTASQALEQLKSLPSLEDTKTQVQNAMNDITTAALRVIPSLVWLPVHGETPNGCDPPYDQTDGESLFLPDLTAGAQISEPDWQTILAAAKESAAKIGATDTQVMQDGPSNHDVGFYSPTGTFIKIGYQGNLVVSGSTGCRLPQNKK